ncbi:MAG TPA: hypothetical protein VET26_08100 [Candidatus Sulfotelmatobacter sp.]|nr:hypothetical protein [Candidatus Sulfotelmatobacter sp.]
MSDCCSPKGYRWIFSEKGAEGQARDYRRKGLDRISQQIVDYVRQQGVEGRSVLEVGGGVGSTQIELLKAGARNALSCELTPTYERVAGDLLRESGLEARVDRRIMDFAAAGKDVPEADIVILNRVICCYPDMPRLAGAAADHCAQLLVLSFPRDSWWIRGGLAFGNFLLRLTRREFQVFVHPPRQIRETAERHGLRAVLDRQGTFWTVAAFRRQAVTPGG